MINNGMFTNNSNEWETPEDFFRELDSEFHFTLDPAATDKNTKCEYYYTKEENGLLQSWKDETVFCNPPYGKELKHWVRKCYEEHIKHNITVVMLIPARTDTSYFHEFIYGKSEIRFLKGRLKFVTPSGCGGGTAPFPSMVVVYRSRK